MLRSLRAIRSWWRIVAGRASIGTRVPQDCSFVVACSVSIVVVAAVMHQICGGRNDQQHGCCRRKSMSDVFHVISPERMRFRQSQMTERRRCRQCSARGVDFKSRNRVPASSASMKAASLSDDAALSEATFMGFCSMILAHSWYEE